MTVFMELLVGSAFARHHELPLPKFATICVGVNLVTQALLWAVLLASTTYISTLVIAELSIWLIEAAVFRQLLGTKWGLALQLSMVLNATSFGVGLFL